MLFFPGSKKHPDIAELLVDMSNLFLPNKTQLYLKENWVIVNFTTLDKLALKSPPHLSPEACGLQSEARGVMQWGPLTGRKQDQKSMVLDGRHLLLVVKNNLHPALTERNAADRCAGTKHTHTSKCILQSCTEAWIEKRLGQDIRQ